MMNKLLCAGAAVAALMMAGSASATVMIGVQEAGVNSGAITTDASGPNFAAVGGLGYGTFVANSISASMAPAPQILDSISLNLSSSTSGVLNVFVTAQDLTAPLGARLFTSSFTENLLPAGWTVTEQTFLDTANGLYTTSGGTVTQLGSESFNSIGSGVQSLVAATGAGPYSVTEDYTISATGMGVSSATIDIASPRGVPEPATWAMMLLGVGLVGAGLRANRKAAIAFA